MLSGAYGEDVAVPWRGWQYLGYSKRHEQCVPTHKRPRKARNSSQPSPGIHGKSYFLTDSSGRSVDVLTAVREILDSVMDDSDADDQSLIDNVERVQEGTNDLVGIAEVIIRTPLHHT